jgi:DNA repair photolyase
MRAIYEPKGAAREYAPLACNLYDGCLHGCTYCYAPGCRRMTREAFATDIKPYPNILQRLEKDADEMAAAGDTRRVLFSFTSDPYQEYAAGCDVTREALQIMVDRGLQFSVCTKGGMRAARDFDLLKRGGQLGVSLVWGMGDDIWPQEKWEPNAASCYDRLASVFHATRHGIYTWASIEPVIEPTSALKAIKSLAYNGCDEFRVGKINHDAALAAGVDWQAFTDECYALLLYLKRPFLFKESLHPYLQGRPVTGGPQ